MDMLKIHIIVSVACILWVNILRKVFKNRIIKNGWGESSTRFGLLDLIVYFIPIVNILDTLSPVMQILYNYEKLEKARSDF